VLKLILLVIPLGLDTFAVSAALGASGARIAKWRLSLLFASFEMTMPLVGLLLGRGLGAVLGEAADYVAIGALALLGIWLIADEEGEANVADRLSGTRGALPLFLLGLSISMDELAIGFTIGLLGLTIWLAIVLIGAQAVLVTQLGLRLGTRLSEALREGAERLAGVALLGLAAFLLVEKLT
jgi:putative Mn2+ efflux pump MntP